MERRGLMANLEIRLMLAEKDVKYYELAKELGIADTTLSKKLRYELPLTKKQEMIDAINRLSNS